MSRILKLGKMDDVAVALQPVATGEPLDGLGVTPRSDIPAGHKVALGSIAAGQAVRKFNQIIGFATQPIASGEHIHTHNLAAGDFERDYSIGTEARPVAIIEPAKAAAFQGFLRPDGRVGTRNYVGILTTVNCSASVA